MKCTDIGGCGGGCDDALGNDADDGSDVTVAGVQGFNNPADWTVKQLGWYGTQLSDVPIPMAPVHDSVTLHRKVN